MQVSLSCAAVTAALTTIRPMSRNGTHASTVSASMICLSTHFPSDVAGLSSSGPNFSASPSVAAAGFCEMPMYAAVPPATRKPPAAHAAKSTSLSAMSELTYDELVIAVPAASMNGGIANSASEVTVTPIGHAAVSYAPCPSPPHRKRTLCTLSQTGTVTVTGSGGIGTPKTVATGEMSSTNLTLPSGSKTSLSHAGTRSSKPCGGSTFPPTSRYCTHSDRCRSQVFLQLIESVPTAVLSVPMSMYC